MISPEQEFRYLLKARNTLLWVTSSEEKRVEKIIAAVASSMPDRKMKNTETGEEVVVPGRYAVRCWDCASGVTDGLDGSKIDLEAEGMETSPSVLFEKIRQYQKRAVWILRDLHDHMQDPFVVRGLKTLARDLQGELAEDRLATLVILSPSGEIPLNLQGVATLLDWPLPTREEIGAMLESAVKSSGGRLAVNGGREAIIDAATGLTSQDVGNALARSMVQHGRFDPATIRLQKEQIINRERVLTWYQPEERGLDAIGGLGRLKEWLTTRRAALTPEARAYGLPAPKGIFLTGPPGNGKSLTAKAVAAAWGLPLLRLDLGALKGGLVGQSEANIRKALRVAEAVAPVVLWLDELEKALAGASGYAGDSGVSADQLGTLLTWLQEHQGAVFCVATSNNPLGLPPEVTRKGRFDEIFFVDLPSASEREDILEGTLRRLVKPVQHDHALEYGLDIDGEAVARATPGFSGAEIAELVPSAMFKAFADGKRPLRTVDLLEAASETVPVSKSRAREIEALRAWAKERARFASDPEPETVKPTAADFGRLVEIPEES